MALLKEAKTELIKQYRQHETDSGSPEVQIAVLTNRITYITEHFKLHKKDHHFLFGHFCTCTHAVFFTQEVWTYRCGRQSEECFAGCMARTDQHPPH